MAESADGISRFVAARVERGWHTQQDFADAYDAKAESLGEKARISVRQVRRWESGQSIWPNRDARRVLDAMFGVPLEDLGFIRRSARPTGRGEADAEQNQDVETNVPRRTFLTGALASAVPTLDLASLDHLTAASRNARRYSDDRLVAHLQTTLDETARTDGVAGPHSALPPALGLITAIDSSAREADPAVRHQLLNLGARAAELVAWLYRDAGAPAGTTAYWHAQAKEWATLTGDGAMHAYVLLRQAQATDRSDAARMLDLARAATNGPWTLPPRPRAEAYQQEARALALTGVSGDQITRILDLALAALDQAAPVQAPPSCTGPLGESYTPERLMVQSAICYREARRPEHAVELFRRHLTDGAFAPRDRAFFTAQLAGTLAEAGEPDEAATVGLQALGFAAGARFGQALAELNRTAMTLHSWAQRPAVRDFLEQLRAVATG